jgi:D-arabinose 1-dehydrogenase-like Zn-dependent alcohol dehydrogenase
MCSGLTAYAALKRLTRAAAPGSVMLVGMGGVGMMGLSLARSVFGMKPLVADIDAAKREAALSAGAAMAFDPSDPGMRKKILEASQGGVVGVCDFVGSAQSFAFSMSTLAKGGKLVVTGLFGGGFDLPLALVVLKAMSIEGVQTGTLAEAQELLRLARDGRVSIPPLRERPLAEAQAALDELRAGRVIGRTVLCA